MLKRIMWWVGREITGKEVVRVRLKRLEERRSFEMLRRRF